MPCLRISGAIPLLPIRLQNWRCIKHKAFLTLQQVNRSNLKLMIRSILILNQSTESTKLYMSYIYIYTHIHIFIYIYVFHFCKMQTAQNASSHSVTKSGQP